MKERLLLSFVCLLLPSVIFAQSVVVWDFATRTGEKNNTTESLTYEFEESLSQNCSYNVLERRNLDRLQAVIQNERALQNVGQITAGGATELKRLGASLVVFGEMFDDVDSGEITITVIFQNFKGQKVLIKSVSIRRGLLLDSASRRESMAALTGQICRSTKATEAVGKSEAKQPAAESTSPQVQPTKVIETKEAAGIAFSLLGCRLSGSVVTCDLSVVNKDDDRQIEICTPCFGNSSRLVDAEGNEYQPEAASLGSNHSLRPTAALASGVPLKGSMRFNGVPAGSVTIKLLEIGFRAGFTGEHQVQFHDIALQHP